jgi:nucleotide-binding universal stress UspA family protein
VPTLLATLENKLKVAADLGVTVDINISDDRDLFRAIMRAQHRGRFDLMVKEAHAPSIIDHILPPDDWRLMRSSLVPVLLVHQDNEWQDSGVLLCVDANPKDEEHRALNQVILDAGRLLRQAGDMHLHLATAYPPDMQGVGKTTTLEARKAQYHRACRDIIHDDCIGDAQIHVGQGPAELLIPQLADELKVKLVVLGTVARSGLKSFLLGNTSEQIIGRLTTDVLVLPPRR